MQSKPLLSHLTGFRAIAAYLVLLGHSIDTAFNYNGNSYLHQYSASFAYLGMTLFFVLSGFVITYTYYDRFAADLSLKAWGKETYKFAVARFARLYPLYIFVMLFAQFWAALYLYRYGNAKIILSHITLTQSWWNYQSFVFPPAWSISTECFFYLIFVVWMFFAARKKTILRLVSTAKKRSQFAY